MDGHTDVVSPSVVFSNWKERNADTCHSLDKPPKHAVQEEDGAVTHRKCAVPPTPGGSAGTEWIIGPRAGVENREKCGVTPERDQVSLGSDENT